MSSLAPAPTTPSQSTASWSTRLRTLRYRGQRIEWVAYLLVLPFVLLFLAMQITPILFGVYVSFTNWTMTRAPQWVGLENYQRLSEDTWVLRVIGNTFSLALLIVPGIVIVALLMALYVNRGWRFSGLVRTFFFTPHVVAITVTALIWVWILERETGVLNLLLYRLGFPKIGWLTTVDWVIPSLALVTIWWQAGYHMVILLAGLQEIPVELCEAALVDGATSWQIFWRITLPLLRPALALVITLEIIASFRIFGQVYLMTNGGPGGRSSTIVAYIYSMGFQRFELGYAAALSLVLFVIIMLFTGLRAWFYREIEQ